MEVIPDPHLPPAWSPENERSYPFRDWVQDLTLWTIMSPGTPAQQSAADISRVGGAARDMARLMGPAEVHQGGMVDGVQLDPVSFLVHGLSARFAPLDEEHRLQAVTRLLLSLIHI